MKNIFNKIFKQKKKHPILQKLGIDYADLSEDTKDMLNNYDKFDKYTKERIADQKRSIKKINKVKQKLLKSIESLTKSHKQ